MDWNYPERPLNPPEDNFTGSRSCTLKDRDVEINNRLFSISGKVILRIEYGEEVSSETELSKVEEYDEETDTISTLSEEELNQTIPEKNITWKKFFEDELYRIAIEDNWIDWDEYSDKQRARDKDEDREYYGEGRKPLPPATARGKELLVPYGKDVKVYTAQSAEEAEWLADWSRQPGHKIRFDWNNSTFDVWDETGHSTIESLLQREFYNVNKNVRRGQSSSYFDYDVLPDTITSGSKLGGRAQESKIKESAETDVVSHAVDILVSRFGWDEDDALIAIEDFASLDEIRSWLSDYDFDIDEVSEAIVSEIEDYDFEEPSDSDFEVDENY